MNVPLTNRPVGNAKRLTEAEKILILSEKGRQSARGTGRQFGVCHDTVMKIWNNIELQKYEGKVAIVKKHLADRLCLGANKAITQVNDKIKNASAAQAAVISGIFIEKMRLLNNKSTQNHALTGYMNICNNAAIAPGDPED